MLHGSLQLGQSKKLLIQRSKCVAWHDLWFFNFLILFNYFLHQWNLLKLKLVWCCFILNLGDWRLNGEGFQRDTIKTKISFQSTFQFYNLSPLALFSISCFSYNSIHFAFVVVFEQRFGDTFEMWMKDLNGRSWWS